MAGGRVRILKFFGPWIGQYLHMLECKQSQIEQIFLFKGR